MTRAATIAAFAERAAIPKKEAERILARLAEVLRDDIIRSGEAVMPGLGKFQVKHRAARIGRNPVTGEKIQIPEKKVLIFRTPADLKEAL